MVCSISFTADTTSPSERQGKVLQMLMFRPLKYLDEKDKTSELTETQIVHLIVSILPVSDEKPKPINVK